METLVVLTRLSMAHECSALVFAVTNNQCGQKDQYYLKGPETTGTSCSNLLTPVIRDITYKESTVAKDVDFASLRGKGRRFS